MPVYLLEENDTWFPPPSEYEGDIIAIGGDLKPERLLEAYRQGNFPWYSEPGEILWWNPELRCVLLPSELHVSHSMRNTINKDIYRCTVDTAFAEVMQGCRTGGREGETWIHDEVVESYLQLHAMGYAHSFETWRGEELVGGLYGVSLGRLFFGESMFTRADNASKFAFIHLVKGLQSLGWPLVDCQVYNDHLGSLGARNIPRIEFLEILSRELKCDTVQGSWQKMDCFVG